ncbi:MAG: paraquat-inducible protein A [Puniceicoccales bacterium]
MSRQRPTARRSGLISCLSCGQLARVGDAKRGHRLTCPTCGAPMESRIHKSFARAWALVITGFILYIPANYFPIMVIDTMGATESDTILTGVIELFQSGMWAIGLLVFCASIAIPLMKLIALSYLLITAQRGKRTHTRDRTRVFRIVEAIGRWSMLDVFLLSILVAVVNLGQVATISPGIGAVFFAAVVVVTMFAAEYFDARVIWDRAEAPH